MLYYQGYTVSFQEVPDETSLVILIADCPYRCPGCHSPELWLPQGKDLLTDIDKLISEYDDVITCVCFMGTGRDTSSLSRCSKIAQSRGKSVCIYTGSSERWPWDEMCQYLKIGPYVQALGGLDSPLTNQKMLKLTDGFWEDITYRFQKNLT